MKTEYKPLSIYIHIPFCVRKCLYCDFLSAPAGEKEKEDYLECLTEEIRREAVYYEKYEVQTVFIGGGTPSLVPALWMERILQAVYADYKVAGEHEITIEVNPGTVSKDKLQAYYHMGINRLSIGLQSAQDNELKLLGRIHTAADFFETYENAVKSGFNNINVDLMSAIPAQTVDSYKKTLYKVLSLKPQPVHISAYSLIIEEGTPFYENTPELPDEETDRLMYKITDDILRKNGYHRYEISNYAKPGYECRHNKVYWKRGDYAGFGIGAASLVNNVRFGNTGDIRTYIDKIASGGNCNPEGIPCPENGIRENIQKLSVKEQMEEYMFLGLRLTEGISCRDFCKTFGVKIDKIYGEVIKKLARQELLLCKADETGDMRIALSEFGLDVSNVVMAEFLFS